MIQITVFSIIPIFRYFYRFFPISISISISISHFFQYQDQYQYFGFQDFKIKININISENLISRSISRSTWPIYWKILENQYIVPSLISRDNCIACQWSYLLLSSGGHMCPECGKVVKDGPTLKEHINMNHKIVTCDECGAQLPKHKLAYHKHQLHTR